jgi:hypothetical protein
VNLYVERVQKPLQVKFLTTLAFAFLLAYVPRASAQQITGRFYPEKQQYLVGEPVIIDFEVVNGSSKVFEISEDNCFHGYFEVDNATPEKRVRLFGCPKPGISGDCLIATRQIPAGQTYQKRFLLEGPFELASAGTYHVRATRKLDVRSRETNALPVYVDVQSEFDITLRVPEDGELEAAYRPLLDDLASRDWMVRYLAASAITQDPPRFAEPAILALADDRVLADLSIDGLKRLATTAARAKLLQMASLSSPEFTRQPAIRALGEIGNFEDCEAMLEIAGQNSNYTQEEAYIMAGHICKEKAIPALYSLIPSAGSQLLMGIVGGLENTSSRNAIPALIGLLQNSDRNIRRDAHEALATLTHRIAKYGTADEASARKSYGQWSKWWAANGKRARIYSSDQCTEPRPLQ